VLKRGQTFIPFISHFLKAEKSGSKHLSFFSSTPDSSSRTTSPISYSNPHANKNWNSISSKLLIKVRIMSIHY
jgi:hypothetical protein